MRISDCSSDVCSSDLKMYSGPSTIVNWSAKRDEDAMLQDAYKIAGLKVGNDRINFTFNDLDGKPVSLTDDRFKDKVVVVQFLGSWCPNCKDEIGRASCRENVCEDGWIWVVEGE